MAAMAVAALFIRTPFAYSVVMMNCQESPFRRRKNFCLKLSSLTRHLPVRAGIILARRPDWKPRPLWRSREPLSRAAENFALPVWRHSHGEVHMRKTYTVTASATIGAPA